jgi:hypothetical protein
MDTQLSISGGDHQVICNIKIDKKENLSAKKMVKYGIFIHKSSKYKH